MGPRKTGDLTCNLHSGASAAEGSPVGTRVREAPVERFTKYHRTSRQRPKMLLTLKIGTNASHTYRPRCACVHVSAAAPFPTAKRERQPEGPRQRAPLQGARCAGQNSDQPSPGRGFWHAPQRAHTLQTWRRVKSVGRDRRPTTLPEQDARKQERRPPTEWEDTCASHTPAKFTQNW
ncbi:hypothetical protein HJG60_009214 [Phyllostomus discolor]|uniref:Uncharacterized protein n=1 Tax=Phyllostomus discolor TaxID=89673 RepID=A0A834DCY0_9CHIR|nr:hypothetical protein HJG60_009214 [Phyllostomus discolor]